MIDMSAIDGARVAERAVQPRPPARDFSHELSSHAPRQDGANRGEAHAGDENAAGRQGADVPAATAQASTPSPRNGEAATAIFAESLHDLAVQPTGITESLIASRVFGVHQLAGRYLSELTAATDQPVAATPAAEAVPALVGEQPPAPASSLLPDTGTARHAGQATDAAPVCLPAATGAEAARSDASGAAGRTQPVPVGAAAVSWTEYLLRFVRQADGRVTIWLRDYRLQDAASAAVIDSALRSARAQGMAVGRIMLNGSEVWSSHNDTRESRT